MLKFVCVKEAGNPGASKCRIIRGRQAAESLEDAVFAAYIRRENDRVKSVEGARHLKVGALELFIVSSKLEIYAQPAMSRSPDSGALYLGHFLSEDSNTGMLLQYLHPGTNTSAHSHSYKETYLIINGLAAVFMLRQDDMLAGRKATEMHFGSERDQIATVTVEKHSYHPLVALEPSLILIVADKGVVQDQVYGTKNNHHDSIPFREFELRFIASGT